MGCNQRFTCLRPVFTPHLQSVGSLRAVALSSSVPAVPPSSEFLGCVSFLRDFARRTGASKGSCWFLVVHHLQREQTSAGSNEDIFWDLTGKPGFYHHGLGACGFLPAHTHPTSAAVLGNISPALGQGDLGMLGTSGWTLAPAGVREQLGEVWLPQGYKDLTFLFWQVDLGYFRLPPAAHSAGWQEQPQSLPAAVQGDR